ncbi:transcriptional repressor LexA [Alicyclobacillus ferrooxydans]|uniref:LexA repressor n=1 Tax=Alicyclobacillus ferrooxydans TaxID=471514 RepID=A0A0P9C806_9BACL|nr:transcriptional repressor LexA [Alicyclobacillus ferrooxydans]KPV39342.1 XRE family transcriptional regulator [Alicyclobacillus ferrooxydans]
MTGLSHRQEQILHYIRQSVRERGYPPSVREIGEAVGLASSSTVHGHLARLQAKGYLRRDPTKPRAIELLEDDGLHTPPTRPMPPSWEGYENPSYALAPIVGRVTAGQPITAIEDVEDYFPLPKSMVSEDRNVFLLKVQGESMIEAGILDGDYVIVRKQQDARNGEIVVAMTEEDEATVKRFFKEKDHIRLQPENQTMQPIRVKTVQILGKVIGVFRTLS